MSVYTIRPLKWEVNIKNLYVESYWAKTPFGSYTVERRWSNCEKWGGWDVESTFDGQSQGVAYEVEHLGKAKAYATKDWISRLRPALIAQSRKRAAK